MNIDSETLKVTLNFLTNSTTVHGKEVDNLFVCKQNIINALKEDEAKKTLENSEKSEKCVEPEAKD